MQPTVQPLSYSTPLLSEEEIAALKSQASLLLHNQLRIASHQPLPIKHHTVLALLESFISRATGQHAPKLPHNVVSRHSDIDYAVHASKTVW